jgi:hypothetical protein
MHKSADPTLRDYDEYIASALRTDGGHLSIGRGGFTLYCARGARISGYDCDEIKACCIAAGLPVIDSRMVAFEDIICLAVRGPMVAVGEEASPPPYHALSYAPLAVIAEAMPRQAPKSSIFRNPQPRRRRKSERKGASP